MAGLLHVHVCSSARPTATALLLIAGRWRRSRRESGAMHSLISRRQAESLQRRPPKVHTSARLLGIQQWFAPCPRRRRLQHAEAVPVLSGRVSRAHSRLRLHVLVYCDLADCLASR